MCDKPSGIRYGWTARRALPLSVIHNNDKMKHQFTARIERSGDMDAAYVVVPVDIRAAYGVGRLRVEATFDGEPYRGSVVNMGVKDKDGNICYVIGITKAIRQRIGKTFGDTVEVTLAATSDR